jgi:hypothetical protein
MRKAFYASAIALLGLAAGPVQAMPIAPLSGVAPDITLVAEGCGWGWHRGPYGGCFRNGAVVVAPRPVVVAPRPVVVAPRAVVVTPAARTYFYWGGRRCWWRAPGVRACV